jgi:hypothetical protein
MSAKPRRTAAVRALEPPVTDTAGAALYVGVSPSYLLAQREEDVKRIARGEEPAGPRWHVIGARVVYLRTDLDAWLAANLTPYGKTCRGRKAGTAVEVAP